MKLLFREEPGNGLPHWKDENGTQQGKWCSVDMQLTYALRKYAGQRSFILPCRGERVCCALDVCVFVCLCVCVFVCMCVCRCCACHFCVS